MLIVLSISLLFSIVVYRQFDLEIKRSLRLHSIRLFPGTSLNKSLRLKDQDVFIFDADFEIYEELKKRIVAQLMVINGGILFFSALASYVLAGKTLKPIEEMWEEQKRFVADASHELRTPLTTLKTEIEVALRNKTTTGKELRSVLTSNLEEVDRMQRLSNYLLTLHSFDSTQTIETAIISLKPLLEKAIAHVQPLLVNKNITLEDDIHDGTLLGNADLLTELITILLDNAVKYSAKNTHILVSSRREKKDLIILIKDQGIGIGGRDIPHIFNRFYRADVSRSKMNVDGYGLGLSIAKKIVDVHNGQITVQSKVNKGTTFTITLPFHS